MANKKRDWHPNGFYHIIVRGNNRQNIFNTERDMYEYFRNLNFVNSKYPFELYAYCIMSNHVHLLMRSPIVPLGKIMMRLNRRYSDYYRKKYNYVGQIYQNRYYSKEIVDPIGLLNVGSYIHRNPIETKEPMVDSMEQYRYSSYQYYFYEQKSPHAFLDLKLLPSLLPVGWEKTGREYARYCRERGEELSESR
ncbi:transposase [Sporosarcina thermotolerans]|uniref:Transposase n=1 Tax=Sporosarcina thermotolerans TaxID=633404 RepID=A0AAW9A9C7_9BACL|nr:transposase [Sporosarcina thermotolerans]MDW0116241.1 transposase [Sporosarcina thermotolerans]